VLRAVKAYFKYLGHTEVVEGFRFPRWLASYIDYYVVEFIYKIPILETRKFLHITRDKLISLKEMVNNLNLLPKEVVDEDREEEDVEAET